MELEHYAQKYEFHASFAEEQLAEIIKKKLSKTKAKKPLMRTKKKGEYIHKKGQQPQSAFPLLSSALKNQLPQYALVLRP